jgi:DNA-binding transcriptional ArsR family regulator
VPTPRRAPAAPQAPVLDAAFAALADPKRRAVIRALLAEPLRAGELAAQLALSPPALSRHLRVLRRARLIVEQGHELDARVRLYRVDPAAFAPVQDWLAGIEAMWQEQLLAFKAYAEGSGPATRTAARAATVRARTRRKRP